MKTYIHKSVVAVAAITLGLGSFIPTARAIDPVTSGFNPNKIIEDIVFADTGTFGGPEGVQKFLESKNSVLANTSPEFLIRLKEPSSTTLKQGLEDPQPALPRLRTAAELIWDASRQSGINPQVLIVTLQKEQGLITNHHDSSSEKLQRALDFAFGFNCPDSTGCSKNSLFPGFYYQLFGNFDAEGNRYLGAAKSLMKSFATPGGRGPSVNGVVAKVGDTIELSNTTDPYNVPAKQVVTLLNNATAALYRFTPHVFNGNYNFAKFFTEWFKYANGTLLKIGAENSVFIVQNGSRLLVPSFVSVNRGLDMSKVITVSSNELESYPPGKVYGPANNTVVLVEGSQQKYVFIDNVKYPASDFVISQRKLNTQPILAISGGEAQLFEQGSTLTPSEGTVIKAQNDSGIYLVEGGKLKLYSAQVFKQHNAASKVQILPDSEVASYPKQGFVAPTDGTLVKSNGSATVYIVEKGIKRPFSGEAFRSRGLSFKNLMTLTDDEVTSFPSGPFAEPGNRTFFRVAETGQLYIFKEGSKHAISAFVAKQRGITPDYTFGQGEAGGWSEGIAIAPKDNTVVKGDGDATIYLVVSGQLRPLTFEAFKRRGLAKKVTTLPQAEVDTYAKGELLEK